MTPGVCLGNGRMSLSITEAAKSQISQPTSRLYTSNPAIHAQICLCIYRLTPTYLVLTASLWLHRRDYYRLHDQTEMRKPLAVVEQLPLPTFLSGKAQPKTVSIHFRLEPLSQQLNGINNRARSTVNTFIPSYNPNRCQPYDFFK